MSGVCRMCGAECAPDELFAVHEGNGCVNCNGSPACSRCGHARRHHRGTFGGGEAGCKTRVTPEDGLAVGRCGCPAYTQDPGALWEPVPIVDVVELRLRHPGDDEPLDVAELAPVHDLFDDDRGLRDLRELDGVPWRPPS